jgi:7-cyano-7-deazaguanine synthase in queuosine biosynthesis
MNARLTNKWSVNLDGHVDELGVQSRSVGDIYAPGLSQPTGWLEPFASDARDLLRVAMAVFQMDRLQSRVRPGTKGIARDLAWSRELDLAVELEEPARWQAVVDRLEDLLWFLTDDTWHLTFKSTKRRSRSQQVLFPTPVPPGAELALFSGGLDSMAGLWARRQAGIGTFIAVSVCGNPVRRDVQRRSVELLQGLGVDLRWVLLHQHLSGGSKPENSQRTRGLLFYCVGAAVASALGLKSVSTYESGPGALNLPLNDAQVGAQNTRANHPGTLCRLEDILSKTLDAAPELRMPFAFDTKGSICRAAGEELSAIAERAISCDEGERGKTDPHEHCGLCTSCILRRAAIYAAIGSADPTHYSNTSTFKHDGYDLAAFHQQGLRLKERAKSWIELMGTDPTLRFAESYHVRRGLGAADSRQKLCDLFERQVDELLGFYDACHPIALARRTRRKKLDGGPGDLFPAAR